MKMFATLAVFFGVLFAALALADWLGKNFGDIFAPIALLSAVVFGVRYALK